MGPPSRGLPQSAFRNDNQWDDEQENNHMRPLLMEPSLNPPDRPVPKNAISVSELDFGRHRAYLLTSDSIKSGIAVQASYKASLLRAKEEKERVRVLVQQEKILKKAEAVNIKKIATEEKAKAKIAADELKALGPKRKVYTSKLTVKECNECLLNYPVQKADADKWTVCDYCGRLYCADASCRDIMMLHIELCKKKQQRTVFEQKSTTSTSST